MTFNCRCTRCKTRKTLKRDPETDYIRAPKCPGCGRQTLRVDPSVRRQTLKRTCKCNGIHYPHRRGTVLSENEFCHDLDLEQVADNLMQRGMMSREEIESL